MLKKRGRHERKKQRRLPIHVYLSYLLVAAVVFTGVTFSRYVTSTNAGDSARAATFGDLVLTENDKPEQFIITPGVNIKKNPLVSYAMEKESESAAYVFVYVAAPNWEFWPVTAGGTDDTYRIKKGDKELMRWSVDSGWKYVTGDNYYKVFYRYIPPDGELNAVPVIKNGEITVSPELYASEYADLVSAEKSIIFKAYAVQANGFGGAEHAWRELYKTVNPKADN